MLYLVFLGTFLFLFQVPSQSTTGLYGIVTSGHWLIRTALRANCLVLLCFSAGVSTMYSDTGCGLIDYDCTLENVGTG